ncbi:S8 family serine peptidase [Lysinibacillus louembei]|uniref:S8 family serine peptidase n=1 Tax=Lysinibacillus louembei TaxID=1470088 RepID=A0ABZ0RZZ9_9BACI|nr:S8 family serine peptidase [Lysinibacillus louembei]WPK12455.1 S8 family serine peptidase [Lysinibacillus louembei]
MRNKGSNRFFAIFIAFIMILSMLSPMQASANSDFSKLKSPFDAATLQAKSAIAEQLEVLNGAARLHPDLQGVSGNQSVKVIVHLSEKPVALEKGIKELAGKSFTANEAKKVEQRVISQQEQVAEEMIEENISFEQGYTYNTVLNGFAAEVKADDLEKLLEIDGITLIEPDAEMYAFEEDMIASKLQPDEQQFDAYMNTSNSFLGIEKLWNKGFEGQGIKVAVLDTGIDKTHPDLNVVGERNFVTHDPKLYNFQRAENDATETKPLEKPANQPLVNAKGSEYSTSHGTHVAGTIAALGNNPYGIKGIAPKVDLYSYRVLGAYGSGSTTDIIKAIEYAVEQQMDVINLSLGGGSNSENDASSFAINNAALAGVIPVVATGNSGPNRGTMGTPSTAPLGIAVGNSTNPEAAYYSTVSVKAGDFEWSDQLNLMATTFGKNLSTQLAGEFELVAVPGLGKAEDYTADVDVDGKIALISRGDIAFVDKMAYAKQNGAVGAIIHNFVGGTNAPGPSGTFLGDSFDFIPTYDMSVTDGLAIREALVTTDGTVSFDIHGSMTSIGDEMNESSSRGPSVPNYDIKPDIVAPGTNIMSTIPTYKTSVEQRVPVETSKAYDRKTGTSMATPHVAGIAALIKQANPNWTPFDVKVALANTATVLNTDNYDVYDQGAGRVNAYEAAFPSLLAYVQDTAKRDASGAIVAHEKGSVTFGPQPIKDQNIEVTKEIVVKDINGIGGSYLVTVDTLKSLGDAQVTVDKTSFTLNGEERITVKLTASQNVAAKFGDELFGYIHITPTTIGPDGVSLTVDQTSLNMTAGSSVQLNVVEKTTVPAGTYSVISLPFSADLGGVAPVALEYLLLADTAGEVLIEDLSLAEGIKNNDPYAGLFFKLTGDVQNSIIELWDLSNPDGGLYEDGYIGYLDGGAIPAGAWRLPITGGYYPHGATGEERIPDGVYTIDFTGLAETGEVFKDVGPIFIKSTPTEFDVNVTAHELNIGSVSSFVTSGDTGTIVTGDSASLTVEGTVVDDYIEQIATANSFGLDIKLEDKLIAFYAVLRNDDIVALDLIELNEDGTFNFDIAEFNPSTDVLVLGAEDAAGNYNEYDIDVEFNNVKNVRDLLQSSLRPNLTSIMKNNVVKTSIIEKASFDAPTNTNHSYVQYKSNNASSSDGPARPTTFVSDKVVDVTQKATYTVANNNVVEISKGLVKAKASGTTTITVKYGVNTVEIPVTVRANNSGGGSGGAGGGGGATAPEAQPAEKPEAEKPEEETTKPEEQEKPAPFVPTDLPANHWAASYIGKMIEKGLLKGNEKGEVKPNANVTRAQFASILARALGLTANSNAPFSDVSKYASETQAEIAAIFEAGIAKGTDGKYMPSNEISRAQLALMLYRAYEVATGEKYAPKGDATFKDLGNYNAETRAAIAMVQELGIAAGDNGKFNPTNPATRAHASKMVINFLEVIENR